MMFVLECLSAYATGKLSASCVMGEHMSLEAVYIDKCFTTYLAYLSEIKLEHALLFAPTERAVIAF